MFGYSHLGDRGEGYFTHAKFAFKYGSILLWAAITSFIHGVLPGVFKFHSAQTVISIYRVLESRGRHGEKP